MNFLTAVRDFSGQPLTRQILMNILREYRRPYDKINELTRQGYLIPVKRGVFVAGPKSFVQAPENMLLANHLWGPGYVSSDSALAYWRLIPERVDETISMTTNVAKTYTTPVGRFRYIRLSLPYYSFGIQMVELALRQMALIAGKEKSICDKIITTPRLKLRSISQTREYLIEDLRISREQLRELNISLIKDYLVEAPKQDSIAILIKTLNDL
ncbi:MAG TPA: hypothetical protein VK166_10465 [Chitinophagaceae bacterium]|nr:hypothetical protein [Chitinophagaceae bacterium]